MIAACELTFTYSGRNLPSLIGINFTIKKGEFVLLTGPTGCGKSTLLRTLNGLIPHESGGCMEGSVNVCGLDTKKSSMRELTRTVGMVFQSPEDQLFSTLVEDEIAFGPENLCLSKEEIETRIKCSLAMVNMHSLRKRTTSTLSGGEKQRIAIASVLAMQPQILVLDEPLSQLDPQGAREILSVLRTLNKNGMTIIIVEHRLPEVIHLVSRVMVMKEGKILLDRPREEAVRQTALFDELGLIPPLSQRLTLADLPGKLSARYARQQDDSVSVAAEGLWFRYSKKSDYSLKGVSVKIRRGEMVAIVGNNGAGKSTLLLHLAAILKPEKGKVMVSGNGHYRPDPYGLAGKVGTMFQNPDLLLFSSTVRQEVEFGPKALSFPPELMNQVVSDILKSLNITHLVEDIPQGLSKGQRLRVAAASILSLRPELVLLDEPTCGQDRVHIQGLMGYLRELADTGISTVFITHHLETAVEYADRILVMNEGRILSEIRPSDEYKKLQTGMFN
ncbi:MAG: energy-coupling factor transporter ATPase [bacterium]